MNLQFSRAQVIYILNLEAGVEDYLNISFIRMFSIIYFNSNLTQNVRQTVFFYHKIYINPKIESVSLDVPQNDL